jgi:hypothetical protein
LVLTSCAITQAKKAKSGGIGYWLVLKAKEAKAKAKG